jgi:hypothetical protein
MVDVKADLDLFAYFNIDIDDLKNIFSPNNISSSNMAAVDDVIYGLSIFKNKDYLEAYLE